MEVRQLQGFGCADSHNRIVDQEESENLQLLSTAVAEALIETVAVVHGNGFLQLPENGVLGDIGPHGFGRRSHRGKNQVDLIIMVSAWEERLLLLQLSKDRSDAPHVDAHGGDLAAEQDLRCAIPARAVVLLNVTNRERDELAQTEISDFGNETIGQQNISGLKYRQ